MLFFHPGDFKHAAPVHCFVPWNFGLIRTNVLLFVQPYKAYAHIVRHHFNLLLCWVRNVISLYYESYFAERKVGIYSPGRFKLCLFNCFVFINIPDVIKSGHCSSFLKMNSRKSGLGIQARLAERTSLHLPLCECYHEELTHQTHAIYFQSETY